MANEFLKVNGANVVKGAGRLLVADLAEPFPTVISDVILTTAGATLYDAATGWTDLGATLGGITITRGFDTEGYSVDQVNGDLGEDITGWTNTIESALAETTLENFDEVWVGGTVTANTTPTPDEDMITFGDPATVPQKRLAIGFLDRYGYIRLYAFRLVQRAGDDSAITHEKGGDPMTLPVVWRAFPDTAVADRNARIFAIFQQVAGV